jgi:uncharacterized damage-inducible protein DinB
LVLPEGRRDYESGITTGDRQEIICPPAAGWTAARGSPIVGLSYTRERAMNAMRVRLPALALLLAGGAVPVSAQSPAAPAGIRAEIIQQLDDAGEKLLALARAMPQEKYSWRPAPGVRSVSEVFVHVAGANFMIPGMVGAKPAAGVTPRADMERTVTDRAQVTELLAKSFAHAKQAVQEVPEAELDAMVEYFGSPSTKRGVLLSLATHAHEHLGQSIAYARMNGVTPPWSRATSGDR